MEATKKGRIAELLVREHLCSEGWEVTARAQCSHKKKGFDFYAVKGNEERYIEVKGVKYNFKVPDLSLTEWKDVKKGEMEATHLYIVGNIETNPVLHILDTRIIAQEVMINGLKLKIKKVVKGRDLNYLKNRANTVPLKRTK